MQAQNIAVLCFTGHKGLFGPQGTGGLCVAPGVDIRPRRVGAAVCTALTATIRATIPL